MTVGSLSTRSPVPVRGRDDVYVAAVPLRATKGPPQLVLSTAYSLSVSWDLQHFVVLSTSAALPSQVLVFDFQPQDPENIYAALAALSGRKIPGVLQTRKMKKLPKTKCWMVGSCNVDVVDATHKFNSNWDTDLVVGQHDCRHYTNERSFVFGTSMEDQAFVAKSANQVGLLTCRVSDFHCPGLNKIECSCPLI